MLLKYLQFDTSHLETSAFTLHPKNMHINDTALDTSHSDISILVGISTAPNSDIFFYPITL
jgi:hypothetical protein